MKKKSNGVTGRAITVLCIVLFIVFVPYFMGNIFEPQESMFMTWLHGGAMTIGVLFLLFIFAGICYAVYEWILNGDS